MAIYRGVIDQEIKQSELTQNQILKLAEDTTELNKFNELQTLAEQVQEYQAELGRHQSEVQSYSAKVSEEAQRVGAAIGQYSSMSQSHLALLDQLRQEYKHSLETL